MANPFWRDERGRLLPPVPCPRCGTNVGPLRLRVDSLKRLGWLPYTIQQFESWCGHTQEVIPFPLADARVRFVPVVGEAH